MKKFFFAVFILGIGAWLIAQNGVKPKSPDAVVPEQPKLVVGIVIDQMRFDYVYRFWNKFGNDGFKRLMSQGFNCRNMNFNYVPTYTGPGHTSIYTGTFPAIHGIISNEWYDRESGKDVYCVQDDNVNPVGTTSDEGKRSPVRNLSTTVGDQLRLSDNMKSKVVGVALKDRAAILPAGHTANEAFWYDGSSGNFISS
ncbi:MAG TPA: alkaline phosphatase family protein, partial [Bacteroidia bacterium]|nr:alkaline phosphatase family protein [Bacteroidia bacterium]